MMTLHINCNGVAIVRFKTNTLQYLIQQPHVLPGLLHTLNNVGNSDNPEYVTIDIDGVI